MTRLAILTSVLAVLFLCLLVGEWSLNESLMLERDGLKSRIIGQIDVKKLQTGQEMASVSVAEVSAETLREVVKPQLDSLKALFHADLKRVEQYQRLTVKTVNHLKLAGRDTFFIAENAQKKADTTHVKIFHYSGPFEVRNDTLIGDTLRTGTDFKNDLQILVRKGKRKQPWKFWKRRPLVGEVYSGNPDTEIKDFQLLKVIEK